MNEIEQPSSMDKLEKVIEKKLITPVFQPIVSLRDGRVFGYEALSRVSEKGLFDNVEEMFRCAEKNELIWQLEQVCRRAILKGIYEQKESFDESKAKLFINVSPRVLHSEMFKAGFTRQYTSRYGIDTEKIVFEITERERIEREESFIETINHYKEQDYMIAIDDLGTGYSGLKRICTLFPQFVKLDISLVREVHISPTKYAMIKGMVEFSEHSGIPLIAEGIETKKELETLIKLGVQYGQGFYLARPEKELRPCIDEAYQVILENNSKKTTSNYLGVKRYYVKNIAISALTVPPDIKMENVLSYMEKNTEANGICIVENGRVLGVLTREKLLRQMGGRYGFALHHNREIVELADKNFLQVEGTDSISSVAKIAMERENDSLYDFIVVCEDGKYLGIVTVQDILKKSMEIDVDLAKSSNPLTGLPGNIVIEEEIRACVEDGNPCTIFYFDLDNFKAFNDVYGFEKGDEVICILSDILKQKAGNKQFVGHIGGDDFVMVYRGKPAPDFTESVRRAFEEKAHKLYSIEDRRKNCITACNRHGEVEVFPLVSVTGVSLTNENEAFGTYDEVINKLAVYKKAAKVKKRLVS